MACDRKYFLAADTVIQHAKIYTVALTIEEIKRGKADFPILEDGGVAIKNGKIIAVGDAEDVEVYVGTNTRVIDAQGRTMIPGIVDSHIHAVWTGTGLMKVDLSPAKSLEDMQAAIAAKAADKRPGEWIEGIKWNQLSWTDKTMPSKEDLDAVAPDNPVYCVRLCYHVAVANSKALELAGITKDTPDPEGGVYERDENGELTGILHESPAMLSVANCIPEFDTEDYIQAIEAAGEELLRQGITSVIDANLGFKEMRAYAQAKRQKRLPYRANLMWFVDLADGDMDYHLKRLDEMVGVTGCGDERMKLNAVKLMLDGIPAVGTAYMRRNYKHMPETCGFPTVSEEDLQRLVLRAHGYGWQVALHTVGNKAADMGIAAYARAYEELGRWDARHYLIHHPWPCDDQFEILRKYDIGIPLQTTIYHFMRESAILEEDMAHQNTPCKQYFDEGIIVGGSSDSPVGNLNPFLSMFVAVTREDSNGEVWGEEQKITPIQALIMYTKNAAYFCHDDEKLGSIEVGNLADLALVDRDFLTGPVEDIRNTKALLTMVDGEVVYRA